MVGEYTRTAEQAWQRVVAKYMIEDARVQPIVTMIAYENWLEFTLRYVADYKQRRSTKDALFTRILEEVDKPGGSVGIAGATLNIEKLAPLEVRLA